MNEGFDKLKSVGAQRIHEETHISKFHVQSVLHESFDGMSKVQFIGFISILEREYNIKLDEVKSKGLEHFEDNIVEPSIEAKVFVEKNRSKKIVYFLVVVVIIFAIFAASSYLPTENSSEAQLDDSAIENAKSTIELPENTVEELNVTKEEPAEVAVVKSFIIRPKSKLWVGYIDLQTHKKRQKTFSEELVLDPEKNWLLSLGHGNVNFEINGEIKEYTNRKNVRFLYKDGELTKLSSSEFKELNKGKVW